MTSSPIEFDRDFDLQSPDFVSAYDELPLWSAMFGLLLLREVPLAGVRRLLDVGCGTGFPLIELAERLGPAVEAEGVDVWDEALRRAERKIASRGTPNARVHRAGATSLPFADATFDLIVSNLGLNNFDDREAAVRECRRVAREGATLALTTNVQGHMKEFYDVYAEVLATLGDAEATVRLTSHVEHRATEGQVRALLESNGFRVTRAVERDEVMRFADGKALLRHSFIRIGFLDGWKRVAADRKEAVFTMLAARLDEIGRRRGEVRLLIPMLYVEATAGDRR